MTTRSAAVMRRGEACLATGPTTECSPAFVMNPYYTGIGIARSLHGRHVPVYALTAERDAPGLRSRYFDARLTVPNGRDEPEALCEELVRLGGLHPERPVLFPTRDFDVLFLHEYHERLAPFYRLPQPDGSPILRVMDKAELAAVALELGVPTPTTWVCRSAQELEQLLAEIVFPVVVKPRFAYQWRAKAVWENVGSQKAFIAASAAELRAHYHRISPFAAETLIQEYVRGDDSQIVVCGCYIGQEGDLKGHFTARKLRQDPPLVGTGCVVEATDVPALVAPSLRLLRAFGYRGIAELEFKHDQRSDTFYLIEVNPRHWDQHELGLLVGVNLTWIAYQDIVGGAHAVATPVYDPTARYKWIAENELGLDVFRRARRELMSSDGHGTWWARIRALGRIPGDLARLLKGRRIWAVARWSDPVPGVLLIGRSVRQTLGRLLAPLRPRHISSTRRTVRHG